MKKVLSFILNPLVFAFLLMILIGAVLAFTVGESWSIMGLVGIPIGIPVAYLIRRKISKK